MNRKAIIFSIVVLGTVSGVWFFNQFNAPDIENEIAGPLLSVETLLTASDVKKGLRIAASNDDKSSLEEWQRTIIDAAIVAGHKRDDLAYLDGERGIDYLRFRGNRFAFNHQVNAAYYNGDPVQPLLEKYPEAMDLHEHASALFDKRDQLINELATALQKDASYALNADEAKRKAIRLWQQQTSVQSVLD